MTGGKPDEPDRRPDPSEVDTAFAEIVARWSGDAPTAADEEHFEPPEPPPLPALRLGTLGALLLLALGVVLVLAPGLLGLGERLGTPLGLLALAGGVGVLVLRLPQGPPIDSGWDDGARL